MQIKSQMNIQKDFSSRFSNSFFSPILSSLMVERKEALILGGVAGLQIGLTAVGLPGWTCPFKALFGIPCPGCGLSTAISLLIHGHWNAAISTHAFAPIFLFGVSLVLVVSVLPERARAVAIQKITVFEKRTGVTTLVLMGLMFYWGLRLLWL